MKHHLLIADDHEDVYENLERKISLKFSAMEISSAETCDKAYSLILKNKVLNPITILVIDLTFKGYTPNTKLKHGRHLLSKLKNEMFAIPTIVYSSHDDMEHIYPIIKNYNPQGYIIKSNTSNRELLFAIEEVINGKSFFSSKVHKLQMKRVKYDKSLDDIDEQIVNFLPNTNSITDWDGKVLKENVPLSYKSIKKRIDLLCDKFEVSNEKQLLLKLQTLAIL